VTPYYEHEGITIYHGDCREAIQFDDFAVLVSDPPYPNNAGHFDAAVPAAVEVLSAWSGAEAMVFWSELMQPPCSLPLVAVHIWHRNNVNGRPYEPIYHFAADGVKRRSEVRACPAVFDGAGAGCVEYVGHPTQKSEPIMRFVISRLRAQGVVLDPFMGSGTTLVAAKRLGKQAIGIDIEERYCEIAAKRLQQEVLPLGVSA
jgi:site-specific DNA-methyltransferase (adenine-specific)